MAGSHYMDGMFVAQGNVAYVNESAVFAAGQLGKEIQLTSPSNSGSLLSNVYKFVQRKAADAAQNTTGVVFSYDAITTTPFVVTGTPAAGKLAAGIWLGDDDATDVLTRGVQAGNFGYLQVGGIATCLSGAAVTAGQTVAFNPATDNRLIAVDWATGAATQQIVGVAVTAAGGAGVAFSVLLNIPRLTR